MTAQEFSEALEAYWTSDGPFRGYSLLGYVGNSDRNYITDEWVACAANELGWSLKRLVAWACSWWGRAALDANPMSQEEMTTQLRNAKHLLYVA